MKLTFNQRKIIDRATRDVQIVRQDLELDLKQNTGSPDVTHAMTWSCLMNAENYLKQAANHQDRADE